MGDKFTEAMHREDHIHVSEESSLRQQIIALREENKEIKAALERKDRSYKNVLRLLGEVKMYPKPVLLFDFDGVVHSYKTGWHGPDRVTDDPVPGMKEAIEYLRKRYCVVVHSSRCHQPGGIEAIQDALKLWGIKVDDVSPFKVPAYLSIDDRTVCFDGNIGHLLRAIDEFQPWTNIIDTIPVSREGE